MFLKLILHAKAKAWVYWRLWRSFCRSWGYQSFGKSNSTLKLYHFGLPEVQEAALNPRSVIKTRFQSTPIVMFSRLLKEGKIINQTNLSSSKSSSKIRPVPPVKFKRKVEPCKLLSVQKLVRTRVNGALAHNTPWLPVFLTLGLAGHLGCVCGRNGWNNVCIQALTFSRSSPRARLALASFSPPFWCCNNLVHRSLTGRKIKSFGSKR